MRLRAWPLVVMLPFLAGAGCGDEVIGSLEALRDRLASAASGDVLVVAEGSYRGPLVLPAGVTLRARSSGQTIIEAGGPGAAVFALTGAAAATRMEGLTIHSGADVALLVRGGGSFEGEQLAVEATRGVGVAAEGLASLTLSDTTIGGNLTAARVRDLVFPLDGSNAPIVGLVLSKIARLQLEDLSVGRFGGFGALLVSCTGSWRGGSLAENVGVAVMQQGGDLALHAVEVRKTLAGERGLAVEAFGLVVAGNGTLTTTRLLVADGAGPGIVQTGTASSHTDLTLLRNGDVGLWLQPAAGAVATPELRLSGAGTRIAENRGGGIFALGSGAIELSQLVISQSREKPVVTEAGSATVLMGDGLQLVKPASRLSIKDVILSDNPRAGLLLSGPPPAGVELELSGVKITGGGKYGVLTQDGMVRPPSWGVTEEAAMTAAAKLLTESLAVAARRSSIPGAGVVGDRGAGGLIDDQGKLTGAARIGSRGLDPDVGG